MTNGRPGDNQLRKFGRNNCISMSTLLEWMKVTKMSKGRRGISRIKELGSKESHGKIEWGRKMRK